MNNLKKIHYLLSMIYNGVKEKDKDCIRSHLEDLNYFLVEKNLLAE